jgi:hypothetical protein
MTLINYTDPVPIPAPLTSGSGIQTYTDPTGELWVAANGVNGGVYRRARDVMHAKWYRNAGYNTATALQAFNWDAMVSDPYSLFQGSGSSYINLPFAAWWRICMHISVAATAVGQIVTASLIAPTVGGNLAYATAHAGAAGNVSPTADTVFITSAAAQIQTQYAGSVVLAGYMAQGGAGNFCTVDFVGTG